MGRRKQDSQSILGRLQHSPHTRWGNKMTSLHIFDKEIGVVNKGLFYLVYYYTVTRYITISLYYYFI